MPKSNPASCHHGIAAFQALRLSLPLRADRCFACFRTADETRIERAHIIFGGPNNATNLLLLCSSCHRRQEKRDPGIVDAWIRACHAEGKLAMPSWYVAEYRQHTATRKLVEVMDELVGRELTDRAIAATWARKGNADGNA